MEYSYNKKSIWKWIVLYVAIGAIAYGLIYYFFFYNKGGYNNNSQYPITNYQNKTADWETYTNIKNSYQIDYPSNALIEEIDTPPDRSACVKITDKLGFILINSNSNIPCGSTGVGIGDATLKETVNIGTKQYNAAGFVSPDKSYWLSFYFPKPDSYINSNTPVTNIRIEYRGYSSDSQLKNELKQIISTFKFTK